MNEAQSPEIQQKVAEWRQRARGIGPPLTIEEMRAAVQAIRGDRVRAAESSAKSRSTKAAKAKPINSDELLNELEGL
jgi:hypothetical protein